MDAELHRSKKTALEKFIIQVTYDYILCLSRHPNLYVITVLSLTPAPCFCMEGVIVLSLVVTDLASSNSNISSCSSGRT